MFDLSVNPILNGIAQGLELSQQPRRRHGQTHGRNEEGNHQENDAVLNRVGDEHRHAQDRHNSPRETEDKGGAVEQAGANPDQQGQGRNQGGREYL